MVDRGSARLQFVNGRVLTLDGKSSVARGLAVRGNRIHAVGSNRSLKKLADRGTEVIDLRGKTVMPGFIDAHAHMDREGLKRLYPSLGSALSIADIQRIVQRQVKRKKPGEWIVTMPLGKPPFYLDPVNALEEGRPPRREELDAVAPDNPVYIRGVWGYWGVAADETGPVPHPPPIIAVANSQALRLAGIDRTTRVPHRGVRIERDSHTGEPTGVFHERGPFPTLEFTLFKCVPRFTGADRLKALRHSMRLYNACGITSVYEGHGVAPEVVSAYQAVWRQRAQTVRAYLALSPAWSSSADAERVMDDWTAFTGAGFGDDWLKIGGIYLEDGGDPKTAALIGREFPYTGWAGFVSTAHTLDEYGELVELAVRRGMRVHSYAREDPEVPLRILERLARRYPVKALRNVFVHLLFASPSQMRRMRRLNIHPTCMPFHHLYKDGAALLNKPAAQAAKAVPLRSLLQAGVPAALSTDNVPYNPMEIMWAAESRLERTSGKALGTRERLSRMDLLKGFTGIGARLSFDEGTKGSLETGKLADLIVLSEDPSQVDTDDIKDIEVLMTMVGGKVVYQKRGSSLEM